LSNCNLATNQVLPDLSNINVTLTSRLSMEEIVNYIYSSNETLQLVAIQNYKILIHNSISIFINDTIEDNVVSRSIELLDISHKYVFEN